MADGLVALCASRSSAGSIVSALAVLEIAMTDDIRSAAAIEPGRINSSPNSRGYFPAMIPVKPPPPRAMCDKMARNDAPRLRSTPIQPPLHVVLVEPEIPPNTGNIARLCAATASVLHLVGPLGFRIDEKAVRRAGIDYWHLVDVRRHVDFAHFLHAFAGGQGNHVHLFSAHATRSYLDAEFAAGDALVFGKE